MSGRDSDKTVFKQPMPGGERTTMRPTPGGRAAPAARDNYEPQARQQQSPIRDAGQSTIAFTASQGLNPIVNAASKLIAVFSKTRSTARHTDVGGLHQRLQSELREFEARLRDQGLRQEQLLSARYLMCSVLDEAVLNTPWGSESPWAQRTLLSVFHGETSGGEKSFLILDKLRQTPSDNLHLIELFYICISLGFEGRYRFNPRGKEALEQLRDELFSIIRRHRGDYERSLSPSWMGLGSSKSQLTEFLPLWFVAVLMVAILFFSYTGLRYWLYSSSQPVVEQLNQLHQGQQERSSE